jgi:hypothetical protein
MYLIRLSFVLCLYQWNDWITAVPSMNRRKNGNAVRADAYIKKKTDVTYYWQLYLAVSIVNLFRGAANAHKI